MEIIFSLPPQVAKVACVVHTCGPFEAKRYVLTIGGHPRVGDAQAAVTGATWSLALTSFYQYLPTAEEPQRLVMPAVTLPLGVHELTLGIVPWAGEQTPVWKVIDGVTLKAWIGTSASREIEIKGVVRWAS